MKRLLAASVLVLSACGASASSPSHQRLDSQSKPLRQAFNEARGKVRAIFLAAPS